MSPARWRPLPGSRNGGITKTTIRINAEKSERPVSSAQNRVKAVITGQRRERREAIRDRKEL